MLFRSAQTPKLHKRHWITIDWLIFLCAIASDLEKSNSLDNSCRQQAQNGFVVNHIDSTVNKQPQHGQDQLPVSLLSSLQIRRPMSLFTHRRYATYLEMLTRIDLKMFFFSVTFQRACMSRTTTASPHHHPQIAISIHKLPSSCLLLKKSLIPMIRLNHTLMS